MDDGSYRALGDRVHDRYRQAGFDELRLPEIAAEELARASLPEFDLEAIGSFLERTELPQDPGKNFSDLPVIVYRRDELYIQLLVWNESKTTIHEHAFSGAFMVHAGSSLHSRYVFSERERVGSRLRIGNTRLTHVDLLERGAVERIEPGHEGLLHALFHLDQPSATVVVRTPPLPWAMPQYSIRKPHFALDDPGLRGDPRLRMLRRYLGAARSARPAGFGKVAARRVAELDLPRIVALCDDLERMLADDAQELVLEAVRARHGSFADLVAEALREQRVQTDLLMARKQTVDPDLRFFLALLLNVPRHETLFELIERRYPGEDPRRCAAQWIARLGGGDSMLDALVKRGVASRAHRARRNLIARLRQLLPQSGSLAADLALAALEGGGRERIGELVTRHAEQGATQRDRLETAFRGLRELPELAPLFPAKPLP